AAVMTSSSSRRRVSRARIASRTRSHAAAYSAARLRSAGRGGGTGVVRRTEVGATDRLLVRLFIVGPSNGPAAPRAVSSSAGATYVGSDERYPAHALQHTERVFR